MAVFVYAVMFSFVRISLSRFIYGSYFNITSSSFFSQDSIVCNAGQDCYIFCLCDDACGPNGNINCPRDHHCNIVVDHHGQYCSGSDSAMRIVSVKANSAASLNIEVYQNSGAMNNV